MYNYTHPAAIGICCGKYPYRNSSEQEYRQRYPPKYTYDNEIF
jgi:hypothetical protein